MRAALVLAIAIALLLGACGGGGDSNAGTTASGTSGGTTGKGANEGSGSPRARGGREQGSKRAGRGQDRRRAQGGSQYSGNVFFYKGRTRCFAIPLDVLARIYQAKSDKPRDVASAYADREAPAPIYRRAAVSGCLAGIESRSTR